MNETFHGVNRTGKIAFIARLPIALTLSPITLAYWKSVSEGTLSLRALLLYLYAFSFFLSLTPLFPPFLEDDCAFTFCLCDSFIGEIQLPEEVLMQTEIAAYWHAREEGGRRG